MPDIDISELETMVLEPNAFALLHAKMCDARDAGATQKQLLAVLDTLSDLYDNSLDDIKYNELFSDLYECLMGWALPEIFSADQT